MKLLAAFIAGIGLSLITVLGDSLIKHSSMQSSFSGWKFLLLGALIYAATAFGWFFVMRHVKLSTLGVLYSVSIVVFLTVTSVFFFKEKISSIEVLAIFMAIVSLALLARFA